jgi:hypothetical protein
LAIDGGAVEQLNDDSLAWLPDMCELRRQLPSGTISLLGWEGKCVEAVSYYACCIIFMLGLLCFFSKPISRPGVAVGLQLAAVRYSTSGSYFGVRFQGLREQGMVIVVDYKSHIFGHGCSPGHNQAQFVPALVMFCPSSSVGWLVLVTSPAQQCFM